MFDISKGVRGLVVILVGLIAIAIEIFHETPGYSGNLTVTVMITLVITTMLYLLTVNEPGNSDLNTAIIGILGAIVGYVLKSAIA